MSSVIAWIVAAILALVFGVLLAETIATGRFSASGRTVIWSENRLGFSFTVFSLASCPLLLIGAIYFGRSEVDWGLLTFVAVFFVVGLFIGALRKDQIARADFAAKEEALANNCCHSSLEERTMSKPDLDK